MSHPVRVIWAVLIVSLVCLVLSVGGLTGCKAKPPAGTAASPQTNVTPPAAPAAPETVQAPAETAQPAATTTEQPVTAAPVKSTFKWAEKPALASIPKASVVGQINKQPFHALAVRLKRSDDGMVLEISDKKPSNPSGPLSENTAVELTLALPEGKPGELVLPMAATKTKPNHAYYHYASSGGPVSMNCPYAVALKITGWTLKTDAANADLLGTVSGQVAICFNDDVKSWVAGTFEGVYFKW